MKRPAEDRTAVLREIAAIETELRNLDTEIASFDPRTQLEQMKLYAERVRRGRAMLESLRNRLLEFAKPVRPDIVK